jgi:Papain family cysteine protease
MTEPIVVPLPEEPGLPYRLGRSVHHDPRSRAFAFSAPTAALVSVAWPRAVGIFDQGNLGSCCGQAAVGWLATRTATRDGVTTWEGRAVDEPLAVDVYSQATVIDPFPGTWEPDDTGSDGLSVVKVLQKMGVVERYEHCFDLQSVLAALQLGPVLVGTVWRRDMFWPDERGLVRATGDIVGGHEYLLVEYDAQAQEVCFANSWGTGWGQHGYGRMTTGTLMLLLAEDGDATVPYAPVVAPPEPPEPPAPAPLSWWERFLAWLRGLFG